MTGQAGSWRRFFIAAASAAAGGALILFAFVALIDPWDGLPLSPPLPRQPVTTSARYAYPMLARSSRFDSVVIGTSTSRPLLPAALDAAFDARFVNLSVNAATAYEQRRILDAFLAAHPEPGFVLIGLDTSWCDTRDVRYGQGYIFPEWLYDPGRWRGYRELLNLFALQEAGKQALVMLGLKRPEYGPDGYATFTPPEQEYDLERARSHIAAARGAVPPVPPGLPPAAWRFPAHAELARMLEAIPAETRALLYFVPFTLSFQGDPGSAASALWSECKRRVSRLASLAPNAVLADFMIPSEITRNEANYWDAIHYRAILVHRLAHGLAQAARRLTSPDGDYELRHDQVSDAQNPAEARANSLTTR